MKILTLGRLPDQEIGGLPMYTANLASALTQLGHEVHVVHPGETAAPGLYEFGSTGAAPSGLPEAGRWRRFRQAHLAAKRLVELDDVFQPDVIHVQYGGAMDLAVLSRFKRLGRPLVVTAHCGRAWMHLGRAPRLAARLLQSADRVLVISKDQLDLFLGAGLHSDKLVQVGSLIEDEFFAPPAVRTVCAPGVPRSALYLGRIAPEKGLETVIAALQTLASSERPRFRAIGAVTPDYARHLRQLAERAGLDDAFELLPPVHSVDSRRAALDAADLLLHPTRSDVKPLVIIEAMARRLPVLASALPGTVELLAGTGETFPPGDEPALAALLRRLAQDPGWLSVEAGEAAHSIASRFTPQAAALETAAELERCLDRPAMRAEQERAAA